MRTKLGVGKKGRKSSTTVIEPVVEDYPVPVESPRCIFGFFILYRCVFLFSNPHVRVFVFQKVENLVILDALMSSA